MKTNISRRRFIDTAAVGLGTGMLGVLQAAENPAGVPKARRLPREVWIGSVSAMGLGPANASTMVQMTLNILEKLVPYEPDIICLPETFAFANPDRPFLPKDVAETPPGPVTTPFINFARTHRCWIICPTYTLDAGKVFIAAVVIDRTGRIVGEYRKMHPWAGEMADGVVPGPLDPPVFETDFGRIGIQICFDVKYDESWRKLKDAGAEIIFWPSAYAGGREISARAWRHQVYVVTSTCKDTTKICDLSGEIIAHTSRFQPNYLCAPVNLEKKFILTWPAVKLFEKVQQKYLRRIRLTTFGEEEWTIIESLDPELKVADVLKELDVKPQDEALREAAAMQVKTRGA
jgi:predicted amidohydrolase